MASIVLLTTSVNFNRKQSEYEINDKDRLLLYKDTMCLIDCAKKMQL
jgi:hypothetical protein